MGDRAMDCSLTKVQVTGVVVIASLLTLLILVLLIFLQRKHRNRNIARYASKPHFGVGFCPKKFLGHTEGNYSIS